jgi:hypothetical protein
MSDDFEQQEYFALVKAVDDFDQRLITIKSWGVTLSLAALGLGFQYSAYGFFLVAAASSLAFWLIEGAVKRHQMRHYPRIREIEVNRYVAEGESTRAISSPRIDWSWQRAAKILSGDVTARSSAAVSPRASTHAYGLSWILPHVALPARVQPPSAGILARSQDGC